jgi:hypothetical protein
VRAETLVSIAKALRMIGQSLESAGVAAFEVEKHGPQYLIWTDSVTEAGEKILRNLLRPNKALQSVHPSRMKSSRVFCFTPGDISRLEAHAQKKRKQSVSTPPSKMLSHGLRTLGDHLDRMQVSAFRIEWTVGSVTFHYERLNGQHESRTFTAEEVHNLCLHPRLRRSSPQLFPKLDR